VALSTALNPDNTLYPPEWRQRVGASESEYRRWSTDTFRLLQAAAAQGDGESMHLIAQYYQVGQPPIGKDVGACIDWLLRAVDAGFTFAANDLYSLYAEPGSKLFDPEKAQKYLGLLTGTGDRAGPIWRGGKQIVE
jgi:TPR repeat protein